MQIHEMKIKELKTIFNSVQKMDEMRGSPWEKSDGEDVVTENDLVKLYKKLAEHYAMVRDRKFTS